MSLVTNNKHKVGQSYLSSVFTTLVAGLHAASMVVQVRPDLVLVNGPGEPHSRMYAVRQVGPMSSFV